ncbi:MAG: cupin domain-containing protein [bacterium]|nr:cupin domain-containing protein [bacterium]
MSYIELDKIEAKEIVPGFRARFVHTLNMTFAYWDIDEGAALPDHSHHHEQVATVLEGRFSFNLDGENKEVGPGDVVTIPPNVMHSGKAVTPCRILDVFHPMRPEYK